MAIFGCRRSGHATLSVAEFAIKHIRSRGWPRSAGALNAGLLAILVVTIAAYRGGLAFHIPADFGIAAAT
jgi:hypothetical protein